MLFLPALFAAAIVNAQDFQKDNSEEVFRVSATIFVVIAIMVFIIMLLKGIWDHRLKSKIVNRGISDALASSLLQATPREGKDSNIKWFGLLAGAGIGLLIVNNTRPLGIHSLAIMVLCISASFLGYFFYLKFSGK